MQAPAEEPREILLDPGVSCEHGKELVNLLTEEHSQASESGKHRIVLEGYGYRWYRVGGLDYLPRRTEIDRSDSDVVNLKLFVA
jgi:maltose alpha-D-glucosyltransferase/alpha-amylase